MEKKFHRYGKNFQEGMEKKFYPPMEKKFQENNTNKNNTLNNKANTRKKPSNPGFDLDEFFEAARLRGEESEGFEEGETPDAEEAV